MHSSFLLSLEDAALKSFNDKISYFGSALPRALQEHRVSLEAEYAPLDREQSRHGGDPGAVRDWLRLWTDGSNRLEAALEQWRAARGGPPTHPLGVWLATRKRRWELLASHLGIPFPDEFLLYRVERLWRKGEFGKSPGKLPEVFRILSWVVDQWRTGGNDPYEIRKQDLASWSLDPHGYRYESEIAIRYKARVPFRATFADKWVDDASFLERNEEEVIVIFPPEVLAKDMEIEIHGKRFTCDQADELVDFVNTSSVWQRYGVSL
jgi:hypothetical protein